jgi:hypothetical protein
MILDGNWRIEEESLDLSRLRAIRNASTKSVRMELIFVASRAVRVFKRRLSSTTWLCKGDG